MDNNSVKIKEDPENCEGTCETCASGCGSSKIPRQAGKIFAVFSGKGGTGKSVVTALIANKLAQRDISVGILDADLESPVMHLIYGKTELADSDSKLVFPMVADNGVKFISMGNVQDKPESPIIWEGKDLAAGALYFYTDVKWDEPDVLFIDMPSGLGDIPLNIYTTLPMSGAICVSTPNDLSDFVTRKSISLCNMLMVPVLGLVENMAYVQCPNCNCGVPLGADSKERADKLGLPLVAEIPYRPELSVMADMGRILDADVPELDKLADTLAEIVKTGK